MSIFHHYQEITGRIYERIMCSRKRNTKVVLSLSVCLSLCVSVSVSLCLCLCLLGVIGITALIYCLFVLKCLCYSRSYNCVFVVQQGLTVRSVQMDRSLLSFLYYYLSVLLHMTKTFCRKRLCFIVPCVSSYRLSLIHI